MMKNSIRTIILLMFAAGVAATATAKPVPVRVLETKDGDSFWAITQRGVKFQVRLCGIDAPEFRQQHGPESAEILYDILGKDFFEINIVTVDERNRRVSNIWIDDKWLSARLVDLGAAWLYPQHLAECNVESHLQNEIKILERKARGRKAGLWRNPKPTPPWRYRKLRRLP